MTYETHVNIEGDFTVSEAALQNAAKQALIMGSASTPCAMTVTITSAERVHELNAEYADKDETTDVLSFPAEDGAYEVDPGDPPYLGDVIIAYPVAVQQASEHGHSVEAELQVLTIHGTLHLLGYDHDTPENQAEMWALESASMDALRSSE